MVPPPVKRGGHDRDPGVRHLVAHEDTATNRADSNPEALGDGCPGNQAQDCAVYLSQGYVRFLSGSRGQVMLHPCSLCSSRRKMAHVNRDVLCGPGRCRA
jgi:hypothetical protein